MEKEKSNKGVITILVIIIIILLALVVLFATGTISLNNNTANNIDENNTETGTITYNMVQSELIATVVYSEGTPDEITNRRVGDEMYIVYPVINYSNDAINELNTKIKANVNDAINKIVNHEDVNSTLCEKFKIEKTGEEKNFDHFVYNEYVTYDTDKYLSIIEISTARTTCASGFHSINNTYVIDKNTKEVLYNTDLFKEVNKPELLEYINNSYDQSIWGEESKETVINNITKVINENKYFVYYDKDSNIVIAFPAPEHPGYLIYTYNGNVWSEGEEPFKY